MGNAAGILEMFQARDSKTQPPTGTTPPKPKDGSTSKVPRPSSGELEERFNVVLVRTCFNGWGGVTLGTTNHATATEAPM